MTVEVLEFLVIFFFCLYVYKEGQQKKPALFDSSSENEDDEEEIDEERFRIRPEYEGKAGKQVTLIHVLKMTLIFFLIGNFISGQF